MEFLTKKIEFFSVPFNADDADVVTFATDAERNNFFNNFRVCKPFLGNTENGNVLTKTARFQWLDGQRESNVIFDKATLTINGDVDVNAFNYLRVTFTGAASESAVNEKSGNVFYFFLEKAERLYNLPLNDGINNDISYRLYLTLDVWQTHVLSVKNGGILRAPALREFYLEQGNFEDFEPYAFESGYAENVGKKVYGTPLIFDRVKQEPFKLAAQQLYSLFFRLVAAFVFNGNLHLVASVPMLKKQIFEKAASGGADKLFNAIKIYDEKWTWDPDDGTNEWHKSTKNYNVSPLTCYIIPADLISVKGPKNWDDYETVVNTHGGILPDPSQVGLGIKREYHAYYIDFSINGDTTGSTFPFFRDVSGGGKHTWTYEEALGDRTDNAAANIPLQFGTKFTRLTLPRRKNVKGVIECKTGDLSNAISITIQATGNPQPVDVTQNFTVPAPYSEAAQYFAQNGNTIALQNAVSVVSVVAAAASKNYGGAVLGAVNLTQNLVKQNEIKERPETMHGNGSGDVNILENGGFGWYDMDISNDYLYSDNVAIDKTLRDLNALQGFLYNNYAGDAFNAGGLLTLTENPRGVVVGDCLYIRGDALIYGVNAETGKWLKNKLKNTGVRIWKAAAFLAKMA